MTQVISPFKSRTLRAARALDDFGYTRRRLNLTSEQKAIARHLAHQPGMTVEKIATEIKWSGSPLTLRRKLVAINIHTGTKRPIPHP